MMVIIIQTIEIPHPMYVTMESAVDSDVEGCNRTRCELLYVYTYISHLHS